MTVALTPPRAREVAGGGVAAMIRIALGFLWLMEGITKYRAGFGAADIQLVVESTAGNSRVPEFYEAFTTTVLGQLPGLFGVFMPLLETGLGLALILGVFTLPAACASIGTLMMYWLADQLTGQYPIMVLLSAAILLAPGAATRYSVSRMLRGHRRHGVRAASPVEGGIARWL